MTERKKVMAGRLGGGSETAYTGVNKKKTAE
jgi:hypothetical protein